MLLHGSGGDYYGEIAADFWGFAFGLCAVAASEAAAGLRAPAASPAASFLGFFAAGGSMRGLQHTQSRQ